MNSNIFLSKEKLDVLANRVCLKVDYLRHLDPKKMWANSIEMCKMVEQSIGLVDSMIIEANTDDRQYGSSTTVRFKHLMICRIYILLYYKHRDENDYKRFVFPELKENMPVFNASFLKDIESRIDKVIEMFQTIEKGKAEELKNQKPMFEIPNFNEGEKDYWFQTFNNNEGLFRKIRTWIESIQLEYEIEEDIAIIWYVAKDVVGKLWQQKYPESFIDRAFRKLSYDSDYFDGDSQLIMLCVYAIMNISNEEGLFNEAMKEIEAYVGDDSSVVLINENLNELKKWLMENGPFDDYNYVGNKPSNELYTNEDVNSIIKRYEKQFQNYTMEIENKDSKIKSLENEKNDANQLRKRIEELEQELQKKDTDYKALNYEYSEYQKSVQNSQGETDLDNETKLGIDERIIFFSSALRLPITTDEVNQSQLAKFICRQTGDLPKSVRPRINKIANMQSTGIFKDEVTTAAQNVINYLNKCFKCDRDSQSPSVNNWVLDMIEDIETTFGIVKEK